MKNLLWALVFFAGSLCAAPVVTDVSPGVGPTGGGTVVTISGSGFTGATAVDFGTTAASSFLVITDTTMTATSPAHVPEVVSIAVTTGSGTSPASAGSLFVFQGNELAFVANNNVGTVSVIDTATDAVIATYVVGANPRALALTTDGSKLYVANNGAGTVTAIDIAANSISTVSVANFPYAIAITPDGTKAYVVNNNSNLVEAISTSLDLVTASISVQNNPNAIAVTPDGTKAYVSNSGSMSVSVIDTASDTVSATVGVGIFPCAIAITPDGTEALVANNNSGSVSVIAVASDTVSAIVGVGSNPCSIAITPDGTKAYVGNRNSQSISVIDIGSNTVIATIPVGVFPDAIVITPDGSRAYVVDNNTGTVLAIDTGSNMVVDDVLVGNNPCAIAILPDGTKAYVANNTSGNVSVVQIPSDTVSTVTTGNFSVAIAVAPDQAPLAKFTYNSGTFDASASASPVGSIVNYFWDFGDGNTLNTASTVTTHSYAVSGNYTVHLTVTNSAGTSTTQLYRGSASNDLSFNGAPILSNGSAFALTSQLVNATANPIQPPTNLRVKESKDIFLTQKELINILTWDPPTGGNPPTAYKIYRNAALTKLAGTVSANGALEFVDHNRKKGHVYTYYVVAVDASGNQSTPAVAMIKDKS